MSEPIPRILPETERDALGELENATRDFRHHPAGHTLQRLRQAIDRVSPLCSRYGPSVATRSNT